MIGFGHRGLLAFNAKDKNQAKRIDKAVHEGQKNKKAEKFEEFADIKLRTSHNLTSDLTNTKSSTNLPKSQSPPPQKRDNIHKRKDPTSSIEKFSNLGPIMNQTPDTSPNPAVGKNRSGSEPARPLTVKEAILKAQQAKTKASADIDFDVIHRKISHDTNEPSDFLTPINQKNGGVAPFTYEEQKSPILPPEKPEDVYNTMVDQDDDLFGIKNREKRPSTKNRRSKKDPQNSSMQTKQAKSIQANRDNNEQQSSCISWMFCSRAEPRQSKPSKVPRKDQIESRKSSLPNSQREL